MAHRCKSVAIIGDIKTEKYLTQSVYVEDDGNETTNKVFTRILTSITNGTTILTVVLK